MTTSELLAEVKSANQDFEWYPTTDEIIEAVNQDMSSLFRDPIAVLDVGAGDGRVLEKLNCSKRFAIEKSKPLLNALSRDIFIVGTDFDQQTLIDKKVDVVFCNPPYSEFQLWSAKIIKEAAAAFVYLVIPERWKDSDLIKNALEARDANAEVLGNFDFLSADRAARAKVDLIRVNLSRIRERSFRHSPRTDPFSIWFDDNFKLNEASKSDRLNERAESGLKARLSGELVAGDNVVPVLERLYQRDLSSLMQTYKQVELLDASILKELNVNTRGLKEALKLRIDGLKDSYWQELFNNLDKVTSKLTNNSRQAMLDKLTQYAHVDFTCENAYAVVIWVIKNANCYFDDQLISLVETMTGKANISAYVSNKKTFGEEKWTWADRPDFDLNRYKLEHRIVISRVGGIGDPDYRWDFERFSGLSERAFKFLQDIQTVACNLGFDCSQHETPRSFEWSSGKRMAFNCTNVRNGKTEVLMEVKAFKNGNLHIKFNSNFMLKLNVEFGRLKGWLKSKTDVVDELNATSEQANESFGSNLCLESSKIKQLVQLAA